MGTQFLEFAYQAWDGGRQPGQLGLSDGTWTCFNQSICGRRLIRGQLAMGTFELGDVMTAQHDTKGLEN